VATTDDELADLSARLERINQLTDELLKAQANSEEARALANKIHTEVRAAREDLKSVPPPAL
jgi:hypothetical protein